jgi:hypothetical protein
MIDFLQIDFPQFDEGVVTNFWVGLVTTIVGILIGLTIDGIRTRRRFRQEMRDNNNIDVSGKDWIAAWQTSVENQVIVNTEELTLKQKGQTVRMWNHAKSPENPKGGYLWEAQLQFYNGRTLMGWYFPKEVENITSKGIMYLCYQSPRRIFIGRWVGASYDGDLTNGFVVISKDRTISLDLLQKIMDKHKDDVDIIYEAM